MNFEEVWQENKSYILGLVGGLIVFGTAYFVITGSFESEIAANNRGAQTSKRKEMRQRVPAGMTREVADRLEALEDELNSIETEMAYRPGGGFSLAGVAQPDIHFNETVHRMLKEIVEPASSLDIRIPPDLGLGTVTPTSDVEREWYLNGLDLVSRICLAGIASGVDSLEPIKIDRFSKKKKDRREESPYVRTVGVQFFARGRPDAVDGLLRGLMLPGARLSIEKATISSLDQKKDKNKRAYTEPLVSLDMKVKALIVDSEGEPFRNKTARF